MRRVTASEFVLLPASDVLDMIAISAVVGVVAFALLSWAFVRIDSVFVAAPERSSTGAGSLAGGRRRVTV